MNTTNKTEKGDPNTSNKLNLQSNIANEVDVWNIISGRQVA